MYGTCTTSCTGTGMDYQASVAGAAGVITYYMIPFPNSLFCRLCSIALGVFFSPWWKGLEKEHLKKQEYQFLRGCFVFCSVLSCSSIRRKKEHEEFLFCILPPPSSLIRWLGFYFQKSYTYSRFPFFFFFFFNKIINIIILNGHLVFVSFPYGRHLLTFVCV